MDKDVRKNTFINKLMTVLLTSSLLMTSSCLDNMGTSAKRATSSSEDDASDSSSGGSGQSATNQDGSISSDSTETIEGAVDLKHIVDPFTGTYKTKVTIPKNYKGYLYISGLNITSLNDTIVKVRFRFGREYEEIIVPATVGTASGITPSTDVQVLILDMEDQPFQDIRLLYDLWDYNDYDTDDDGIEFGTDDDEQEPTTDVRDSGLYCRGLYLEDDPTFTISTSNDACDTAGEVCYYSYARILDSGLYYENDSGSVTAITPSEPMLDLGDEGYTAQSETEVLKKCLPDVGHKASLMNVLNIGTSFNNDFVSTYQVSGINWVSYLSTLESDDGNIYYYLGPYRTVSRDYWEVSGDALFSDMTTAGTTPSGLFQGYLDSVGDALEATDDDPNALAQAGFKSFLFPRAGTMSLSSGVEYIGYTDLTEPYNVEREITSLVSSGDSDYMDGCNLRVSSYDEDRNEHIGSCNVTATIDVITEDSDGDTEVLTTSTDLKLQLTRESETDYEGNEVRYSALNKCSNSNACGSDECCFNERCWSKDIVSQCLEDVDEEGNLSVGETCSSDYQCQSLCCSSSTGACATHNPDSDAYCSKSPGQECVSQEFCREEEVQTCYIVNTGTSSTGETTCALRCYYVPTYGDCIEGSCVAPETPDVPDFDADDPDCSDAIDPPTSLTSS